MGAIKQLTIDELEMGGPQPEQGDYSDEYEGSCAECGIGLRTVHYSNEDGFHSLFRCDDCGQGHKTYRLQACEEGDGDNAPFYDFIERRGNCCNCGAPVHEV